MLVITRRNNEELIIGRDIRVRVVAIRGQRVQLGIEAPLEVPVRRTESPLDRSWNGEEARVPLDVR